MKLVLIAAAAAALSTFSALPQAEAAGWRSCKATAANCSQARPYAAKPVKAARARRIWRSDHDGFRGVSTREWFYRQMLNN